MILEQNTAMGQWGEVMVEVLHQTNDVPSAFHDLYPFGSTRGGVHHVAIIVDDLQATVAALEAAGQPVALTINAPDGTVAQFMDTVRLTGHFTELYEGTPTILGLYEMVRKASVGADLSNPIIRVGAMVK